MDAAPQVSQAPQAPPTRPLPVVRALLSGFFLRCPVCGKGAIFSRRLMYRVNERCAACGREYMPDRGEITGGMAMTMVLTSILGIAGVIYLAVFTALSPAWAVAWLVLIPTLFALWFYRHAHGLWVATLYVTRSLDERHPLARQESHQGAHPSVHRDAQPGALISSRLDAGSAPPGRGPSPYSARRS